MALKLKESGTDHYSNGLPEDVCALLREDTDEIVGYKVRWREEDENGIRRRPSKSFSARRLGSLDQALTAACQYLEGARAAVRVDGAVARPDPAAAKTPNDLLQEWILKHGPEVSYGYARGVIKLWAKEIEHRPIARMRLERISADPGIFARFQDELVAEGIKASKRYEILKNFRAVMQWGRRRYPGALTVEIIGLLQLPSVSRSRLAYAADAIGLERIIEAVLNRPARDVLLPLRDAALVAAMGFTIATRPSEWRLSATWEDLYEPPSGEGLGTVELQRASGTDSEGRAGLKTGAHVALVLPNAYERIDVYRQALEERYGPQPKHGLIFQVISPEGPVWAPAEGDGAPVPMAWTKNNYNQWVKRVFAPARDIAAGAPDAPPGLGEMVFYDCRHTAISLALHSTLVVGPHGMNLHPLAGWAGHDIQTLQRYYSHLIARYMGQPPIEIVEEGRRARVMVETKPFKPKRQVSPQREEQRRRRARAAKPRRQRSSRRREAAAA
jgi:hypothetical protein